MSGTSSHSALKSIGLGAAKARKDARRPGRFYPWVVYGLSLGALAACVLLYLDTFLEFSFLHTPYHFKRPWAALLLPVVLTMWILSRLRARKDRVRVRFSRMDLLKRVPGGIRLWLSPMPPALRLGAVCALTLALMRPQSMHAKTPTELEGIDIVVTLDLSLSMQASDIAPSRFEAMKAVVDAFVRNRPNDRIGAVVFGRDAYTLLPMTSDHSALRSVLAELQLGLINGQGTAIGNAVGTALNRLRESKAESRVVILLTDGDSNSGNISPQQAADLASTFDVKLYTILMGQSGDAKVQRGLDMFGRPVWDRGKFPVNPALLKTLAEKTGGSAYTAGDRRSLEESFHSILDKLKKSEIQDLGVVYGELYPAFLWPALLWLVLEGLLGFAFLRRWP